MCKYDANGFCRRGQSCRFIHKWVGKNTQDNRMESRTWDMDTRARQRPFFEVSSNGRRMWQNKYEVREGYTGQQNFNEPIKIEREQKEEREKATEIIIKQIREELREEIERIKTGIAQNSGNFWMPMNPQTRNFQIPPVQYVT